MQAKYTKEQIVADIKAMDKRAATLTDAEIDMVMNEGYAELMQYAQPFADEAVVPMSTYYDAGEKLFTIDIEDDVVYIYDVYGTIETVKPLVKVYDADGIYQDGRMTGRVHVDLDMVPTLDNVVIKYTFTPSVTMEDIFMDKPTYNCTIAAFRVALDVRFKDFEREAANRQRLQEKCLTLLPNYPFDMGSRNF